MHNLFFFKIGTWRLELRKYNIIYLIQCCVLELRLNIQGFLWLWSSCGLAHHQKANWKLVVFATLEIKSSSLLNKGCNMLHYGFSKVNTSPNKGRGHFLLWFVHPHTHHHLVWGTNVDNLFFKVCKKNPSSNCGVSGGVFISFLTFDTPHLWSNWH